MEATAAPRRAQPEDLEAVTETLWLAFAEDPLWRWAFPDHAQLRALWRLYVSSALKHEWVWTIGDFAAATVWIPPGRPELTPEEEALVPDLVGERAQDVLGLFDAFETAHPHEPPHYYLTLLGTRPDSRGQGLGMRLLRANLDLIDAEASLAGLPGVEQRGQRAPLRIGRLPALRLVHDPGRARNVVTMWRDPAAPAAAP